MGVDLTLIAVDFAANSAAVLPAVRRSSSWPVLREFATLEAPPLRGFTFYENVWKRDFNGMTHRVLQASTTRLRKKNILEGVDCYGEPLRAMSGANFRLVLEVDLIETGWMLEGMTWNQFLAEIPESSLIVLYWS